MSNVNKEWINESMNDLVKTSHEPIEYMSLSTKEKKNKAHLYNLPIQQ